MGTGPEDGGNAQLYLQVQEVVPSIFEKQVLEKTKKEFCHSLNVRLNMQLSAELTKSRSIVLSRQSSCATTAWLEELVYNRDATSLATCKRVFPSGSSSTPREVSTGFR